MTNYDDTNTATDWGIATDDWGGIPATDAEETEPTEPTEPSRRELRLDWDDRNYYQGFWDAVLFQVRETTRIFRLPDDRLITTFTEQGGLDQLYRDFNAWDMLCTLADIDDEGCCIYVAPEVARGSYQRFDGEWVDTNSLSIRVATSESNLSNPQLDDESEDYDPTLRHSHDVCALILNRMFGRNFGYLTWVISDDGKSYVNPFNVSDRLPRSNQAF